MKTELPDSRGKYGVYGGRFSPETLMPALTELEQAFKKHVNDAEFQKELAYYLREFAGRPTPLYYAKTCLRSLGGQRYTSKEKTLYTAERTN